MRRFWRIKSTYNRLAAALGIMPATQNFFLLFMIGYSACEVAPSWIVTLWHNISPPIYFPVFECLRPYEILDGNCLSLQMSLSHSIFIISLL